MSCYTVTETTTDGLAGDEGAELWREHVRFNHGALRFGFLRARGFAGSTVVQRAGEHQLVEFWSDTITYSRGDRQARDDAVTRIVIPRRGIVGVTGERTTKTAEPGAAVALPRGAAFALRHDTGARAWILTMPATVAGPSQRTPEPTVFDLRTGVGAVARDVVRAVSIERDALGAADFVGLLDQVAALLRSGAVATDDLAQTARAVARRRASDPTLTPSSLAHELGWSLRRLQRSLHEAGTSPAELIREARLDAAWRTLRADRTAPVAEVAFSCGFGSLSAFNDAFRRRYGMTPRDARPA